MTPGEIARRQVTSALGHDWQALEKLYAADVHYVDPDGEVRGRDAAITRLKQQLVAFPDVAPVTISSISEGDHFAVSEWSATVKNTGPLALPDGTELPATGRDVVLRVMTLYELKGDEIVSERNYWDNMAMYAQLGLLPE